MGMLQIIGLAHAVIREEYSSAVRNPGADSCFFLIRLEKHVMYSNYVNFTVLSQPSSIPVRQDHKTTSQCIRNSQRYAPRFSWHILKFTKLRYARLI